MQNVLVRVSTVYCTRAVPYLLSNNLACRDRCRGVELASRPGRPHDSDRDLQWHDTVTLFLIVVTLFICHIAPSSLKSRETRQTAHFCCQVRQAGHTNIVPSTASPLRSRTVSHNPSLGPRTHPSVRVIKQTTNSYQDGRRRKDDAPPIGHHVEHIQRECGSRNGP